MNYIVILMSFQTIYSIKYGEGENPRPLLDQNFEKFIAPPSVYRELSEPPPLMPENISVYFTKQKYSNEIYEYVDALTVFLFRTLLNSSWSSANKSYSYSRAPNKELSTSSIVDIVKFTTYADKPFGESSLTTATTPIFLF
jgi:hypothetical protein